MSVLNKHCKYILVSSLLSILCMYTRYFKRYGHSKHSFYYLILISVFSVHFLGRHLCCHQQPDLSCGHSGGFSVWGPQGGRPDGGWGPPRGNHCVFHTTRKCCREVIITCLFKVLLNLHVNVRALQIIKTCTWKYLQPYFLFKG